MGQAAADGSAIAHLDIADRAGCLRQQGTLFLHQLRAFYLIMCGERADDDFIVLMPDPAKPGNSTEIDKQLWIGEPELH